MTIDIKYSNNTPNVVFAATVTWCGSVVRPPITLKHYDVWVNEHGTDTSDTPGTNLTQSVRPMAVGGNVCSVIHVSTECN